MKETMSKVPLQPEEPTSTVRLNLPLLFMSLSVILLVGMANWYFSYMSARVPQRTSINSIEIGGLEYAEAAEKLNRESSSPEHYDVVLTVDDIEIASSSSELDLKYRYAEALAALKSSLSGNNLRASWAEVLRPLFMAQSITVPLTYDEEKVAALLSELNKQVAYEGEVAAAKLEKSGQPSTLKIFPGKQGRAIDIPANIKLINQAINTDDTTLAAVVASTSSVLSDTEVEDATLKSGLFIGRSAYFSFENTEFKLNDQELIALLAFPQGINTAVTQTTLESWKARLNRPAQDAVFEYDQKTLVVSKFSPPRNGQALDENTTRDLLAQALQEIQTSKATSETVEAEPQKQFRYELSVATTPPSKPLSQTNNIGISELIGFGDSYYNHSIPNRIYNVALATERVSNKIIPPGGEFSFNKAVGDVSSLTGYKSAYVIMNGKTVLGDGGGVCQVSTTVFRSVLNAGLRVTRRLPHSYRVSYYELDSKPGVDATVYTGETDFRFVNDTDQHILLHAGADSKNTYMFVEIYGTSDGRSAEIVDHITWNYRNPPPAQYFPDPSLPAGKLKQIDWSAPGINASFVNRIKDKDGNVIREDKYISNYRPWSAKYLQGVAQ